MTQLKLDGVYFMLIIYVIFHHGSHTSAQDICERDLEKLKSEVRGCGNLCETSQCKNPRATCVCDGACGYVCVTPDLRCSNVLESPKHGKVNLPTVAIFQSTADYTCDDGFDLIGPKQRTCQSDGKWSGNEPFCTPEGIRCSEPKFEIENAYITYNTKKDEYYVDDEVKFTCDLGYTNSRRDILTTTCERKDENTADWTPIQFTCKPVFCKKPEDIDNGYYEGNKLILGSEINYHCNQGYYLVGFATRVCLAEKIWSSSPPTCQIVQCLEPPKIANGEIQFDDYNLHYLSFIQYKCNTGYVLEGPSVRQCDELGEFTGDQPVCTEIDCGQPEKPENGTIAFIEGTQLNKQVHYRCDPHTTTHGSTVAECKFEQQVFHWTPQPPLCIQHCKVPDKAMYVVHENQKVHQGKYIPHKENVRMYCDSGYEADNRASNSGITSTCVNGEWANQINCKPAKCHKNDLNQRHLNDLHLSTNRIPHTAESGENITLSCNSWYPEADKTGVLKCSYGKWQLPEPDVECRKKSCDITHVPFPHGAIYYNEKKIDAEEVGKIRDGEYFELICTKTNYELYINKKWTAFESSQVYCNEGDLSKNTFECRQITRCECSVLEEKLLDKGMKPNNCYNKIDSGKRVNVVCAEGYSNPSATTAKCLNTHWQIDNHAKCKKKCKCSSLDLPKSVELKRSCPTRFNVRSDTSLQLVCTSGFTEFSGSEDATCSEGDWLVQGYCHAPCSIPNIPHSVISITAKAGSRKILTSANKIYHSDRIKISCHDGYYLPNQNDILQCINGRYDEEIPKCIQDLTISDTEPTSFDVHDVITFRCFDIQRFLLKGNKSMRCLLLKWKGEPPTCQSLKLRSTDNAPVITYNVDPNREFVDHEGTLIVPQDSTLSLRCWWFKRDKDPNWRWNNQTINFKNVEPSWSKEEYYELVITEMHPEHTGYFTCTSPNKKIHGINVKVEERKETPTSSSTTTKPTTPTRPTKPTTTTRSTKPTTPTRPTKPTTTTRSTKPTTPTRPTMVLTTTTPETTRLTMYITFSTNCQAGLKAHMDIFVNGKQLTGYTEYFNHNDGLIFRCTDRTNFKLIGEASLFCAFGKWTSKWPYCIRIYANNIYSPPPVRYLSGTPYEQLDTGDYWAESYADHYFVCYYGSMSTKPIMEINGKIVTDNAVYDYYNLAWHVKPVVDQGITLFTFKCQIPRRDENYSNTLTVFLQDKCVLDEVWMQLTHNAVVVPRSRRFPFYVRGNVVFFECDSSGKAVSIPQSITCSGGGNWEKSHRTKYCP